MRHFKFILIFICFKATTFAQCTEAKDADMARYKSLTKSKDAQGCSQCAILAFYFCSARHCVEMEDKRKVRSMIEACKTNIRNMGQPYCCNDLIGQEPQWGIAVSNNNNSDRGGISENDSKIALIENKVNAGVESFYAFEAASNARNKLKESSKLNGNYTSFEELEIAFKQKLEDIARSIQELEAANNNILSSGTELLLNNDNGMNQAVGQMAVGIGSMINRASAENKREIAEQRLRSEKARQIQIIKKKKEDQIFALRKEIFSMFRDGGIPLSTHKIKAKELFFFAYIFDKNVINTEKPILKVSNVFSVARFADDTWPFKNNLVQDISKMGKGAVTLMGYYTSLEEAEKTRESFIRILPKANTSVSEFVFKSKKTTSVNTDKDFWGEEKNNTKNSNDTEKQSDFWDK